MAETVKKDILLEKQTRFEGMLYDMCVSLGFCGGELDGEPSHVVDYIPSSGTVTADQFVTWMIKAEGMSVEAGDRHRSGLREIFTKHMNAEIVDAEVLVSKGYVPRNKKGPPIGGP